MKPMKPVVITMMMLTFLAAAEVPAQGATGFAGFGWGTPRAAIIERLVTVRCAWHMTMTTVRGNKRVVCRDYELTGVGRVQLTLEFINDALRGYRIAVPRRAADRLKARAPEIVGAPAEPLGPWRGQAEITERNCLAGLVCLGVTTY
jgi:hypothetical protein